MSTTKTITGPIKTHSDGSMRVKVWRNDVTDAPPYFNVTIEKSYLEPVSGKWRDTKLFSRDDMLKLQPLLGEAYQTIRQEQALGRKLARTQEHDAEQGLTAQRDDAMEKAQQQRSATDQPAQTPQRDRSRQPEQ